MKAEEKEENSYQINYEKQLGKGQYGVVYDCSHPQIKEPICAKILKTDQMDSKLIHRESEILLKLKTAVNPNLVKIYDVIPCPEKKELHLIMEKCNGGDLKQDIDNRISQQRPYTMEEVLNILQQIVNGYRTLFEQQIIHRDLKPANILLNDGMIKITDFGMGRVIDDMTKKYPHTKVGTPAYAAPQLYLEPSYSSKSDVYSLGIILFQLVNLSLPFKARQIQDVVQFLKSLKFSPFKCEKLNIDGDPQQIEKIKELINHMLIYKEEERTSWEQLFEQFSQGTQNITKTKVLMQLPLAKDQQKIDDSIFQLNLLQTQQKFNQEIFKKVAENIPKDENINRACRINHLTQIHLAKGLLAYQLSDTLLKLRQTELQFINNLNYYLLQTCIIGYRFKVIQNAYGFSCNFLALICDEMRHAYKTEYLKKALEEYIDDKSECYEKVRNQVLNEIEAGGTQFKYIENQLIKFKYESHYPSDISNFYRLINSSNNTQYKIYGKWFQYFYRKDLKKYLVFDETKTYSTLFLRYHFNIMRFLALVEMFLQIDEKYPYENYSMQNPKEIYLLDEIDQAKLIQIIKDYRQS